MNIVSVQFACLTVVTAVIFYLIPKKYRYVFLTLISSIFVALNSINLLLFVLLYASVNYFIGIKLARNKNNKTLFRIGVFINLAQLILLKYPSFAIDPIFKTHFVKLSEIIIPLGISYFTLQGIGYLINIKMGWEKSENNFFRFLLYIIFFPKFLSGPIERSNSFLPQIIKLTESEFNEKQVADGLRIALIGFFKKVAIANQLAPYVYNIYSNIDSLDGASLWIVFIIQPLFLYFDFSGYTDIAIGFSKLFGIEIMPNFNKPFLAENVTTFWKRFHISLSSWFHDYIFRQASFKRRRWGIWASLYAVLLTWVLFGIWHGAGWNFMALGFLQALAIYYEFFTKNIRLKVFSPLPNFSRIWIGRIFTYLFYCFSLILFFSPDLRTGYTFITKLSTLNISIQLDNLSTKPFDVIIYIPVFLLIELLQNDYQDRYKKLINFWSGNKMWNQYFRWSVYSLLITIMFVVGLKAQQFVYANF